MSKLHIFSRSILSLFIFLPIFVLPQDIFDLCRKGDLDSVRKIISADPSAILSRSERGSTPLHFACFSERPEMVEYLLEQGAEVNAVNDPLYTPLHYASQVKQPEILRLLLSNRADIMMETREGEMPLHMAASSADIEAVKILLEYGSPVDATDSRERTPLLLSARESGDTVVASTLLAAGANIDFIDTYGDCALELAAWRCFEDFVHCLLNHRAAIPEILRGTPSPLVLR